MKKKRAEYRLAPEAVRDLEGIWLHTLGEWGIDQAHRYTDDLTAAFDQLARPPQLATACDHIRKDYRRSNGARSEFERAAPTGNKSSASDRCIVRTGRSKPAIFTQPTCVVETLDGFS